MSLTRDAGTVSGDRRLRRSAARCTIGLAWIKALTIRTGLANVIAHVDRVLAMMSAGLLDPSPLVTHHMSLDDAARPMRCMTGARR